MRIMIESTTRIVNASGVDCRVWQGRTESGVPIQVLVPRIAALTTDDLSEFERELNEHAAPSAAVSAFPLRMIL